MGKHGRLMPCQPVFDSIRRGGTESRVPSHSYTDQHSRQRAARPEQPRRSWFRTRNTSALMESGWTPVSPPRKSWEQEKENEKSGKSSCQLVSCESVNGESASPVSPTKRDRKLQGRFRRYGSLRLGACPCARSRTSNMGGSIGKRHNSASFEIHGISDHQCNDLMLHWKKRL